MAGLHAAHARGANLYFLHNSNFGPNNRDLDRAIDQMRAFQDEVLIRCVGMRGPHRFATERLTTALAT